MEFSKTKYDEAFTDFMEGKGNGCPSVEVCEILMRYNPQVNKACLDAVKNKKHSISIMPYGDSIVIANDPVYKGPFTTTMDITLDSHKTLVHFDRN